MCVQVCVDQLSAVGGLSGKRVAVCGLGPAGLLAVQFVRVSGAREIVGIEPRPDRRLRRLRDDEHGPSRPRSVRAGR